MKKEPQYTPDEKLLFSQPQSFSRVIKNTLIPVFGFGKERDKRLVTVAIHKNDVLLTKRLFIYDGGTVGRPYDFDNAGEAKKYTKAKPKVTILFYFQNCKSLIKPFLKKSIKINIMKY